MPRAERNIAKGDSKADKTGGRSKKTRAKAKNVTQTVIVNVGKRGGGSKASSSAPPRPTPLQQALQLVQATRPPQSSLDSLRQGESLVQSTQILQRMLEPIKQQLQVLMKQPVPPINITQPPINISQPPINITQPPINIMQPAIRFPPINITQPPINFPPISVSQTMPPINFPPINITQTIPQALVKPQASMASMASQTELAPPAPSAPPVQVIKPFPLYQLPQLPLSSSDYVLDLPDAPLVQPAKPLVPAGPLRLDPEHEAISPQSGRSDTAKGRLEDVPIVEAEAKEEEKEEEEAVEVPIKSNPYARIPLTQAALSKLVYRRKDNTSPNILTLYELAKSYYGLTLTADIMNSGKQGLINYLIAEKGVK